VKKRKKAKASLQKCHENEYSKRSEEEKKAKASLQKCHEYEYSKTAKLMLNNAR
jgi:hypothetical protein